MGTNSSIIRNALLVAVAATALSPQSATSANEPKVAICHATASVAHPYVRITVKQDAVDGDLSGRGGSDHFGEHVGPIGPLASGEWGDIIPPIPGVHEGLNWDDRGAAIHANGCSLDGTEANGDGGGEGGGAY